MTFNKTDSKQAKKELKALLEQLETSTIFVVQRGVSRSGIRRYLDLYVLPGNTNSHSNILPVPLDGQVKPLRITHKVARALQRVYNDKRECLEVSGCGMDMHFATVSELSCALYCPDKYDHDAAYRLQAVTI
jgi:hypothetical protein